MNCLLLFNFPLCLLLFSLFLLPRSLSFAGKMLQEGCSTSHAAGRRLGVSSPSWNASAQLVKLCTPQCAWLLKRLARFCRSGRIDFLLAQKYELLQSNSCLLGCERVMETRAEFHFSWVYTFSATLSSCGTAQTTIDTGCDPALPRNCVDHPADCNLFKTITLLNSH